MVVRQDNFTQFNTGPRIGGGPLPTRDGIAVGTTPVTETQYDLVYPGDR